MSDSAWLVGAQLPGWGWFHGSLGKALGPRSNGLYSWCIHEIIITRLIKALLVFMSFMKRTHIISLSHQFKSHLTRILTTGLVMIFKMMTDGYDVCNRMVWQTNKALMSLVVKCQRHYRLMSIPCILSMVRGSVRLGKTGLAWGKKVSSHFLTLPRWSNRCLGLLEGRF